ncbi:ribonuclease 3-like protein 3 [Solanum stenotomum]|uniref:ribonuclease 3-like protein 3 n=1 Tax=Solanum stenotomum TaxID=172797 RepID=UPI0020D0FE54|nr:ribonuclease 3-like protein 3 [Solanum stenotomum]
MEVNKVEENLASLNIPSSQNLHLTEENIRNQLTHDDDHKHGRMLVEELEKIIRYTFKNPNLLHEAFTHSSFQENSKSYERLELLGDSILNMLVTKKQFFDYPDLPPGRLTTLRSANVDNEKLARVAIKYNLHNYLRHKMTLFEGQVKEFKEAILEYPLHSLGLIDPPKTLADIVESLIGAISIDSDCMNTTWQVVSFLLEPLTTPEKLELNPITKMYELCQKNGLKTEFVDKWDENGEFEVFVDEIFVGKGKSSGKKITAKNRAAHNAYYQVLRILSEKATIDNDQHCDGTQS